MYAVISVESSPVVSALHKVCLKISEKGFSHQDMMRVPVTDFIDPDVAGTSPELRPRAADLASFTAGYLGRLIRTPEFQSTERVVREKVRHLSFLVHLVCRLDDFEAVYREFLSVEEVLTIEISSMLQKLPLRKETKKGRSPRPSTPSPRRLRRACCPSPWRTSWTRRASSSSPSGSCLRAARSRNTR